VFEWFLNDFQAANTKVITGNRSKWQQSNYNFEQLTATFSNCMYKMCLVLGLLVIDSKTGMRLFLPITMSANHNHNYFQQSFENCCNLLLLLLPWLGSILRASLSLPQWDFLCCASIYSYSFVKNLGQLCSTLDIESQKVPGDEAVSWTVSAINNTLLHWRKGMLIHSVSKRKLSFCLGAKMFTESQLWSQYLEPFQFCR